MILGAKLKKNDQINAELESHADYIFKEPQGSFFPSSSPLYRFIEEGAIPVSNRQQMRKDTYTKEVIDKLGNKTDKEFIYWRNVWAANVKQARLSRSKPLITSLGVRHVPLQIQAMNQVAFDSPPEIYVIWFYKYFMTVYEGKELTDKIRYALLGLDKDHFRDRVAFLHLWVAHNLPKQKERLINENAELLVNYRQTKLKAKPVKPHKEISEETKQVLTEYVDQKLERISARAAHRSGTLSIDR